MSFIKKDGNLEEKVNKLLDDSSESEVRGLLKSMVEQVKNYTPREKAGALVSIAKDIGFSKIDLMSAAFMTEIQDAANKNFTPSLFEEIFPMIQAFLFVVDNDPRIPEEYRKKVKEILNNKIN